MKHLLLLALLFAATALTPYVDFEIVDSRPAPRQTRHHIDFYPWQATIANYTSRPISCHVSMQLLDAQGFEVGSDARSVGVRARDKATVTAQASVDRGTPVASAAFEAGCR